MSRAFTTAASLQHLRNFKQTFTKNSIAVEDLTVQYSRSSGPGGQNVNKVNTKVEMRFPIHKVKWLPEDVKTLLRRE
ncbi:Peptidyl-tRNA hydrolase ict1, mitochondrial, partial [Kappamyces sp. JEL0680]